MKNYFPIYVVIGCRGTGKTSWSRTMAAHFNKNNIPSISLDLDQQIEKTTNKSIAQWLNQGEASFRNIEKQIFKECLKYAESCHKLVFLSVGAGFTGRIPKFCRVIHLKRYGDKEGRIFMNRPQLLPQLNPFDEFQQLHLKRASVYKKQRDFVFVRQDYVQAIGSADSIFFGKTLPFKNAVLTLNPKTLPSNKNKWQDFFSIKLYGEPGLQYSKNKPLFSHTRKKYPAHLSLLQNTRQKTLKTKGWNLKYFEFRDDEVSKNFLKEVLKFPIQDKILLSFRKKNSTLFKTFFNIYDPMGISMDWPSEWGKNLHLNPNIYSLHQRKKIVSLKKQLKDFSKFNINSKTHLKLAVEIFSFEELLLCHQWWQEDSLGRSFHPRSMDGRWKWYRLLFGPRQPLYFIRENDELGTADQPLMAESVRTGIRSPHGFACVLGDPVALSATPFEQESFFKKYKLPVVPILMKEKEMTLKNLKILECLGLKFAAVTSPLKKKAYQMGSSSHIDSSASSLKLKTPPRKKINKLCYMNTPPLPSSVVSSLAKSMQSFRKKGASHKWHKKLISTNAINTLIFKNKKLYGYNTDIYGSWALLDFIPKKVSLAVDVAKAHTSLSRTPKIDSQKLRKNSPYKIAVWGGGGVQTTLQTAVDIFLNTYPDFTVVFYSARTGKKRHTKISPLSMSHKKKRKENLDLPDILVWAVGRSRMPDCLEPPPQWKPQLVLDVNYYENSPGKEYALKTKASYISGWVWFKEQALFQRKMFQAARP